jgi:hypothetical protein
MEHAERELELRRVSSTSAHRHISESVQARSLHEDVDELHETTYQVGHGSRHLFQAVERSKCPFLPAVPALRDLHPLMRQAERLELFGIQVALVQDILLYQLGNVRLMVSLGVLIYKVPQALHWPTRAIRQPPGKKQKPRAHLHQRRPPISKLLHLVSHKYHMPLGMLFIRIPADIGIFSFPNLDPANVQRIYHTLYLRDIGTWRGGQCQYAKVRLMRHEKGQDGCIGIRAGRFVRFVKDGQDNVSRVESVGFEVVVEGLGGAVEDTAFLPLFISDAV